MTQQDQTQNFVSFYLFPSFSIESERYNIYNLQLLITSEFIAKIILQSRHLL